MAEETISIPSQAENEISIDKEAIAADETRSTELLKDASLTDDPIDDDEDELLPLTIDTSNYELTEGTVLVSAADEDTKMTDADGDQVVPVLSAAASSTNKRKREAKPVKRLEKGDPAQAKMRAVRATRRRRERSATAIARLRVLVPGVGSRTEHTRVIENLLAYLRFFSQAIDQSDLNNFFSHFINRPVSESPISKNSEPVVTNVPSISSELESESL